MDRELQDVRVCQRWLCKWSILFVSSICVYSALIGSGETDNNVVYICMCFCEGTLSTHIVYLVGIFQQRFDRSRDNPSCILEAFIEAQGFTGDDTDDNGDVSNSSLTEEDVRSLFIDLFISGKDIILVIKLQ